MDLDRLKCNWLTTKHYSIHSKPSKRSNKTFILFLMAQGFSELGSTFRFIAITSLLIRITGSGLSAGIGFIFSTIPCIILSLFAGLAGDLLPVKYLLVSIELIRSMVGLFFAGCFKIQSIYLLSILASSLDAFYGPSLRKSLLILAGKNNILKGNAFLDGIRAITSIFGSLAAGTIIGCQGIGKALLAICYFHSISALLLIFLRFGDEELNTTKSSSLKYNSSTNSSLKGGFLKGSFLKGSSLKSGSLKDGSLKNSTHKIAPISVKYKPLMKDIKEAWHYVKKSTFLKKIIVISMVISFGVISINMAFYPFAFDVLGIKEKEWTFMMSIFYGSSLIAMGIALWINRKLMTFSVKKDIFWSISFISLISIASIWFLYSFIRYIPLILFLQLLEGTLIHLSSIFLISKLQTCSPISVSSRIMGLNDFLCSISKIFSILLAYFIIRKFGTEFMFLFNAVCLVIFVLINI